MSKLWILIGLTVFSWIGWWLGAKINFFMGFVVSGVGSMLGVYVGWRINRDYFD